MLETLVQTPYWVRLFCVCAGSWVFVLYVFLFHASIERPTALVAFWLIYWLSGTAWTLSGRAHEVGGWGQLEVSEVLLVPVFTLCSIVAPFFILALVGFGHMH